MRFLVLLKIGSAVSKEVMMKKLIGMLSLSFILLCGWSLALPQQKAGAKPDRAKILGTWNLEVSADSTYIYLALVLEESSGQLSGKISEQNGMFTDAPLSDIEYDGENLTYDISVPSPPDGLVKVWKTQLKVGDDVAEGGIANLEFGMSAVISAKRVKK
jgi:hypothetical protein